MGAKPLRIRFNKINGFINKRQYARGLYKHFPEK